MRGASGRRRSTTHPAGAGPQLSQQAQRPPARRVCDVAGLSFQVGVFLVRRMKLVDHGVRRGTGAQPQQIPFVDRGPDLVAHAGLNPGAAGPARQPRRIPAIGLAVDLPQLVDRVVHVVFRRRVQRHARLLQQAHAPLGQRGDAGVSALRQARPHVAAVLLAAVGADDGGGEVVGHGADRDQARVRFDGLSHPARQLGVRPAALQDGVRPDQLQFVQEHDPALVAGALDQLDGKPQALRRQLGGPGRPEGTRLLLPYRRQPALDFRDLQPVSRPERFDPAVQLDVVQPLVDEQARGEHPAEQAAGGGGLGPLQEVRGGPGTPVRHQTEFFYQPSPAIRHPSVLDRGPEHLPQVVERRLLADGDPAAHETTRERPALEMRQQVRLARAEVSGDQHPQGVARRPAGLRGPGEQRGERLFRPRLVAAQHRHRIPVGHAVPQSLDGAPLGQPLLPGHRHVSRRPPHDSRTSAATGLTRFLSRTSSITRVFSAS